VRTAIEDFGRVKPDGQAWKAFAAATSYVAGPFAPGGTDMLRVAVEASVAELDSPRKLFFGAVPPAAFAAIARARRGWPHRRRPRGP
jgi:hypothetical protein